jgi:hypothetical protein
LRRIDDRTQPRQFDLIFRCIYRIWSAALAHALLPTGSMPRSAML